MTTVTITVQAPEANVTVEVERDTVTESELCGVTKVHPTALEVLDDAVRRARAAYAEQEGQEATR